MTDVPVPSAEFAEIARRAERAGDLDVYFAALDLYDRARADEIRREATPDFRALEG